MLRLTALVALTLEEELTVERAVPRRCSSLAGSGSKRSGC
jgi:hypothetical protein